MLGSVFPTKSLTLGNAISFFSFAGLYILLHGKIELFFSGLSDVCTL